MKSATECLEYLISTDEEYGRLRGEHEALDYLLKVAEATGYKAAIGTQEQRKACGRTSEEYERLVKRFEEVAVEFHTTGAKRKTCELVIEVWRSQNANRRVGNV